MIVKTLLRLSCWAVLATGLFAQAADDVSPVPAIPKRNTRSESIEEAFRKAGVASPSPEVLAAAKDANTSKQIDITVVPANAPMLAQGAVPPLPLLPIRPIPGRSLSFLLCLQYPRRSMRLFLQSVPKQRQRGGGG